MMAYCQQSLVVFLGLVFQLAGLPIGGVLSGAAVGVRLGAEESRFIAAGQTETLRRHRFVRAWPGKTIRWKRYVDDLCAASHTHCSECILAFLAQTWHVKCDWRMCCASLMEPYCHL